MQRRNFVKLIPVTGFAGYSGYISGINLTFDPSLSFDNREYWISVLTKIADPVLYSLSTETLRKNMPVECIPGYTENRKKVTYLEAFGRLVAGIAPWLELGADNTNEGQLRKKYIELTQKCLSVSVNPSSPDYMNFTEGGQPLVDAAFLAHGIIRGYTRLWQPLNEKTKQNLVDTLKSTSFRMN